LASVSIVRINNLRKSIMQKIFWFFLLIVTAVNAYTQNQTVVLSHYVFKEFTPGVVRLKSGNSQNVLLNYNSLTNEMVFNREGKVLAMSADDKLNVDTVYIGGRKFVLLNATFVELLYQNDVVLFAEHKCKVNQPAKPGAYGTTSQTSSTSSISQLSTEGGVYQLKLPDGFEPDPFIHYWITRNGKTYSFSNMRHFRKIYKDKQGLIRNYISDNPVNFKDHHTIRSLVQYLEEN
jgi:hypothetical protein